LLGAKVDFDRLKAANFKRVGIISRITIVAKKKDSVYRTGNCSIACFRETFNMVTIDSGPYQCHTVADIYLWNHFLHKVVFTIRSRKSSRSNLPTSAQLLLNEFIKTCYHNIGPPIANIEDWGYVWENDESLVKVGILKSGRQFFVIWELKHVS